MYDPPQPLAQADHNFRASQLPSPPSPPPVRRSQQIGTFLGIASLVILSTAFSVLFFTIHGQRTPGTTPTAAQRATTILGKTKLAHLNDTQFTLSSTSTTAYSSGTTTGSITFTTTAYGSGAITARPFRMHCVLHVNVGSLSNSKPVVVNEEEIIDATDLYLKLAQLPGQPKPKKPWTKIALGNLLSGTPSLSNGNPLDYSQLHGATYVGEETIAGAKTWHLHASLPSLLRGTNAATATVVAGLTQGLHLTMTEDLWLREDTDFPAKIVIDEQSTLTSASATPAATPSATPTLPGTFTTTLTETIMFTAWNTGITIALPPANQVTTSTKPTLPGAFGMRLP